MAHKQLGMHEMTHKMWNAAHIPSQWTTSLSIFGLAGMKVESGTANAATTGATTLGFTMALQKAMVDVTESLSHDSKSKQDDVDDKCSKIRNLGLSFLCHAKRDVH